MVLIDTSAWIESLRPDGDPVVRARVQALLQSGEAAWCPMVRLELWNGARGAREKRVLREIEAAVPCMAMTPEVWARADDFARKARAAGRTVPATDILVAACAQQHAVEIEHADEHFRLIARL